MKRVAARTSLVGLALAVALGLFLTGCRPEDIGFSPPRPVIRGLWFGKIENVVRDETQYVALELEQYDMAEPYNYSAISGRVTYYTFLLGDAMPVFYTSVSGYFYPGPLNATLYWEDLGRRFEWSCDMLTIQNEQGYQQQLRCSHPGFYMQLARSKEVGWGR